MPPPTPIRERTRREIVARAMQLFATRGYDATSLQDIASAVGCSKAAVLYHFGGKQAVFAEAAAPSVDALLDLLAELRSLPSDAVQQAAITGVVRLAVRFRGLLAVLPELLPTADQRPELVELLDKGRHLPELLAADPTDPREVALAEFALSGLVTYCREPGELTDDDLRSLLETALSRLLLPASARPPVDPSGFHSHPESV